MHIQPLTEGNYFHIYSRGINGEDVFKERRNYYYFMQQYKLYCADVFDTLAYALLKNHFHLLVYVKENAEVVKYNGTGTIKLNASRQIAHCLNSYSQSINKAWKRTGALFESPFERRLVNDDSYITDMIFYCHYNAQKHGFVQDFKQWEFTSYNAILNNDNSICLSQKVLDWFGGKTAFEHAHVGRYDDNVMTKFILE
ncbi:hypothetical protein BH11BAC3_BH11BAC3_26450 [soil metagenome]